MPTPIAHIDRLRIVKLRIQGGAYESIAQQIGCSKGSVRTIWRRYEARGMEGMKTSYHNSGVSSPYDAVKELVAKEKKPEQGAPYIRSVLLSLHADKKIPHERTIQRWWNKENSQKKKMLRHKSKSENPGPLRFIILGK
jgi:transposase-like protein